MSPRQKIQILYNHSQPNHRLWIFWGFCTHKPWPIWAKFGMQEYTHALHSHVKFHLDQFTVSPLRGRKIPNFTNFNFNILLWRHRDGWTTTTIQNLF